MNWIFTIAMILIGILSYLIGLTRGVKETEAEHLTDYDKGWLDAAAWYEENFDLLQKEDAVIHNKRMTQEQIVKELGDLFGPCEEEEDGIINCGEY